MEAPVRASRELAGVDPQRRGTSLPANLPSGQARVAVLLRGASMWALEAALAAGAIATALLLGVGR